MRAWRWLAAWGCLTAIAIVVSLPFVHLTIDDAFITYRQALRLAHGSLSYNAGTMVEASSSLLHVVLIAAMTRVLHVTPEMSALPLGILGIALTAGALTWHVREHVGADSHAIATAIALPAVILTGTSLSIWWFYGLETPLWIAALAIAAASVEAWAWRGRDGAQVVAFAAAFVLPLIRPEAGLIALGWFASLSVVRRSAWPRLRWLLLTTALTSLALGIARLSVYGLWFPAPVYTKGPTAQLWRFVGGAHYVINAFEPREPLAWLFASSVVVAAAFWLVQARRPLSARFMDALPALILCAPIIAMAVVVGGDWMPGYRLVVPAFPLLGMAVVSAGGVRPIRILPIVVIIAATGAGVLAHPRELDRGLMALARHVDPCTDRVIEPLVRLGRPDEVLAATDIGLVGYRFPGDVLDYFGLANPSLSRAGRGEGRATADDVLKGRPAWVIAYASGRVVWPAWPTEVEGYVRPVTESLTRSEVFRHEYEVFDQCEAYPGRWTVLMRRRTSEP